MGNQKKFARAEVARAVATSLVLLRQRRSRCRSAEYLIEHEEEVRFVGYSCLWRVVIT
jgi:hypothetical protein